MNNSPSLQSRFALNSLNFFIAEVVAVAIPYVSDFLKEIHWRYDAIGLATSIGALGTFLAQTPAGFFVDQTQRKRLLLGLASLVVGICYLALPYFGQYPWAVYILLFASGAASAFFGPLLGTLALWLVGQNKFGATLGVNQAWSHVGNIAVALLTMSVSQYFGIRVVFIVICIVSLLASASLLFIRASELKHDPQTRSKNTPQKIESQFQTQWKEVKALFKNPHIKTLLIATTLLHLANAPTMSLVALNMRAIGGTDQHLSWLVFISQFVMTPTAWFAGKYCQNFGRKPFTAVVFILLPIRILLYALTQSPNAFLAIQVLDGIINGIYGVVILLIASDLTRGTNTFNSLFAMTATTIAAGCVLGPLIQGFVTQHLGFIASYLVFASAAILGAIFFLIKMPETAIRSDQLS